MASRPRFQRPSREYPTPSPEKERRWVRAANQPRSTGFRAGGCSRGVQHRFLTYTFPSRSPRPTHPAVLNRRDFVEAAPTLTGDSRIRLPPASLRRYDDKEMDGLSPPSENSSASWRTSTAPRTGDAKLVRSGRTSSAFRPRPGALPSTVPASLVLTHPALLLFVHHRMSRLLREVRIGLGGPYAAG